MKPRRSDFLQAFLRSFAVQGSWNYRTLIGGGLGFALAPLLRRIHAGDPVALRRSIERHAGSFNAHPYMSPIAIGAFARLEHDGADEDTLQRFRTALRGPLGALGDQAVWAGWRPFCVLCAIVGFGLGLDARFAAVGFLAVYNAGHLALRIWGFRLGWSAGLRVGGLLNGSSLRNVATRLTPLNEALMGASVVLLVVRAPGSGPGPETAGVVAAAAMVAFFVPSRAGRIAMGSLLLAISMWWL